MATDRRYIADPEQTITYISHSIHRGTEPRGVDIEIAHEFDDHGNHRLRNENGAGEWAGYAEPAHLRTSARSYAAFTDHSGENVYETRKLVRR